MRFSKHDRHARFGTRWLELLGPLALTALLALAPANSAFAQGAVKSVHKDWQIRCDTPPGAKTEQCALIQSVTAEDRANVGLTVIVLKTADQKSRLMRVVAPLGVLGAKLRIENRDSALDAAKARALSICRDTLLASSSAPSCLVLLRA